MGDYLKKAINIITEAIKADDAGDFESALSLYTQALNWFELEIKYSKNGSQRERVLEKMKEYLSRAEELKNKLTTKRKPVGECDTNAHGNNDELAKAIDDTILAELPSVKWEEVIGLDRVKSLLKEAVVMPLEMPHLFEDVEQWKGILLYGPPGTGKTHLAKALATEAGATFFTLSASRLMSKWQGESERLVRALFESARQQAPSIVFIDEIDSLLSSRDAMGSSESKTRVVSEFLVQLDGINSGSDKPVLFLGATNLPWDLDTASISRFERKIYVPLPDESSRATMFEAKCNTILSKKACQEMAKRTHGYSGRDIKALLKVVFMVPITKVQNATRWRVTKDGLCYPDPNGTVEKTWDKFEDKSILRKPELCIDDFIYALENSNKSVDPTTLKKYDDWTEEYGINA